MDPTAQILDAETKKWLLRLQEKNLKKHPQKEVEAQLVNVRAYMSDCQHFLDKKDYVRAFEAIIYAWGIFDTLRRLHLIKVEGDTDFE